ncbi:MAG: hypothetical protein F6J89_31265 [Symploca sp. SIO1C4]|uniref:Pentapeptide repeat-containing protein n=1 Tax=Symploca sp. SIO1C4 TaxID=2607765 RepID=A0A6B3NK12_9CYAN|nr:hypothetical protein [Symploca sp. SIO1C4]
MKASEVIRRYKDGERDFRRVSLRGESFKRQNLAGADFSEADIRGTNFTHAYLIGAKLVGAKAGLQRRWATFLVIISWLLSAWSGIFSIWTSLIVGIIFEQIKPPNIIKVIFVPVFLIVLAVFLIVTIRKNLAAGFGVVAIAGAGAVAIAGASAIAGAAAIAGAGAAAIAGAVAGTLDVAVAFAFAVAIAGAGAGAGAIVFAIAGAGALDVAIAIAIAIAGAYIGWRGLAGDEKHAWVRTFALEFAATKGTSFYNANLTDADFTGATLKNTDLRKANLTRTRWHQAKKLDRTRPGKTYLKDAKIQQLLITLQGQNQNLDYQSLPGVNLQGANLADASFIGTDLNEANLQDADLSRAKLVQTQLDEADLTGATLTGATIEDWNITSHTQLQGVRCKYVFMRLPTEADQNPRRKPDNWEEAFEDGDFADFIKPIVDTLDLYHNQGVDPRAIAISFKQLAENNPDAQLEIVAMEKRGEDKFLLRAATAPEANHSQLNAEYFTTYNEIKALAEAEVQKLIAEKDSRIASLENMVETALRRPSFYAQTYQNQGDTMSNAPKRINKNEIRGGTFGGGFINADTVSADHIGGDTYNYAPEQQQNLADAAAEIQQLLQQLEQTYPDATAIEKQSALAVTLQQEIKQNPTLRARLKNALKEGGIEALKVLFAPIGIPIEMVRGWIEAEA